MPTKPLRRWCARWGNNATHATNQTLIPRTPFDASKDFAAIGLITTVTHMLMVESRRAGKVDIVKWATVVKDSDAKAE